MRTTKPLAFLAGLCLLITLHSHAQHANWYPSSNHLVTQWAEKVDPDHVYEVYPRPTMQREKWLNLNGLWELAFSPKDAKMPQKYNRHILVPFAPESALSGVDINPGPDKKIWYKRTFIVPETWSGKLILLNIGASDWETTVYVNGNEIGLHRGGYDPFTFDISYFLKESGKQEIEISVWDPTNKGHQPRGKQTLNPEGIWYTSVSGIWQTVWIEPVSEPFIQNITTETDIDKSTVQFTIDGKNTMQDDQYRITIYESTKQIAKRTYNTENNQIIDIIKPKLWSPDSPFLYTANIELIREGQSIDNVKTYFGMRKIEVKNDSKGVKRIFLNNKPIFMLGLLDQGWWPDGLYTAPHPEALKYDILQAKNIGFNTLRKHVKVEPELWYYYCDQLGMLVWQDMPNGDENAKWKGPSGIDGVEITRSFESEAQYKLELKAMIKTHKNHPSIIGWVPFNEGWGQFNTTEIISWVKELDPSRLVGGPSGGNYFPVGDIRDFHQYPGPGLPPPDPDRALVLGEFGGLGYQVKKHSWQEDKNWGYRKMKSTRELQKSYTSLVGKIKPLIDQGLCAAIYTQLSDVEIEVNGLLTYDRKVIKLNTAKTNSINKEILTYFNKTVK